MKRFAIIVIGRNEGDRLKLCFRALTRSDAFMIYVDSGSTDNSVEFAKSMGAQIISLDPFTPFTAARARNAGLMTLRTMSPETEFAQFIDGDCEINADWLKTADRYLSEHADVVAICGRRSEKFIERSIFNRMCDHEWDVRTGDVSTFGGDFYARLEALNSVGGFKDSMIAGEEPELCVRLRMKGWRITRISNPMTTHDANILKISQWWKRAKRAGHAFAEGYDLHGKSKFQHNRVEVLRPWIWAAFVPVCSLALSLFYSKYALLILLIYLLQYFRGVIRYRRDAQLRWKLPFYEIIGKFAEITGQIEYLYNKFSGKAAHILEYKG